MTSSHRSSVVIGASIGGLLAARALSTHFDRVTVVERDVLLHGADIRKGVPQSAHARYLDRVHAAASDDPVVCRKFFDVLNLLAPPTSLMSPLVMRRVLARAKPRGPGSPIGR